MEKQEKSDSVTDNRQEVSGEVEEISRPEVDAAIEAELAEEKYDKFAGANGAVVSGDIFGDADKKRSLTGMLKDKKVIAVAVALVALLLLLASILGSGSKKSSDDANKADFGKEAETMQAASKAMQDIRSYAYEGKIDFSFETKNDADKAYSMDYRIMSSGITDKTNEQDPSYHAKVSYHVSSDLGGVKDKTDLDTESLHIDGKDLLRLNAFTAEGSKADAKAAGLQSLFKDNAGSWYEVNAEERAKLYGATMSYFSLPTEGVSGLNAIGTGGANDLSRILSDEKLLTFMKDLGEEQVGEVDAVHYEVGVDAQEALSVIADLLGEELNDGNEDFDKFKQAVEYTLGNMDFEVWIGKDDKLVHRFKASGAFDRDFLIALDDKLSEIDGGEYSFFDENTPETAFNLDLDYTLSGFGASSVGRGVEAKSFGEIATRLEAAAGAANTAAVPTPSDRDGDGLGDADEATYGADADKPDTDGDGYKDGEEVKNGYDPIVAGSARLDYSKIAK